MKSYNEKRDFSKTPEPKEEQASSPGEEPVFVVQKHEASRLHYDFRLQIHHTLKSWAVPKGPSLDPSVKRMAVPTEDHPIAYGNFEGVIPEGEYGGGTVMIWDRGRISSAKQEEDGKQVSLEDSFDQGSIEVLLEGTKLKGVFQLIEMKSGRMAGNWLLIKKEDSYANTSEDILEEEAKSSVTGRTMEEIAKEKSRG